MASDGGLIVFDEKIARDINDKRLAHLDTLGLDLAGKRVLDAGCGVGHLAQFFIQRGCDVTCFDGRRENIESLAQRYPWTRASVLDIEREPLDALGAFEVVLCYGLLYHLENPFAAIRKLAGACSGVLLLETIVTDHKLPLTVLVRESGSPNQALFGVGNRPSPSFVVTALRAAGFEHVYLPKKNPDHPDFQFSEKNNLDNNRRGHNLRRVFIASRSPLDANPALKPAG